MPTTRDFAVARQRVEAVLKAWPSIEGWPGQLDSVRLTISSAYFQALKDVSGSICEIGVHHGKFFLLLDALRQTGEAAIALDLFEDQSKNVDNSGLGNRDKFLENIELLSHDPDATRLIAGDSLEVSPEEITNLGNSRVRLFSVDGGHTAKHAANDIMKAEQVLCEYGVVIVDDYFDPSWSGVHVGAVKYLTGGKSQLAPFAGSRKKLFLCHRDVHSEFLEHCANDKEGFFSGMRIRKSEYDDLQMVSISPN